MPKHRGGGVGGFMAPESAGYTLSLERSKGLPVKLVCFWIRKGWIGKGRSSHTNRVSDIQYSWRGRYTGYVVGGTPNR